MKSNLFVIIFSIYAFSSSAQNWKEVGGGATGFIQSESGIYKMFNDSVNNVLYAAGAFTHIGNVTTKSIAKWDGVNWNALGAGINYFLSSVVVLNGDVYVASSGKNKVQKWDGVSWSTLPVFSSGSEVDVLAVVNGELYAGGNFYSAAGSPPLRGIARWTGTAWDSVGGGVGSIYYVYSIAEYQGKLVAAGMFQTSGGDSAKNIAIWDGATWSNLGSGVYGNTPFDGWATCLLPDGNDLYVGGRFIYANGDSVNGIAKWNGSVWDSVGNSPPGNIVWNLEKYNNEIFVIGTYGGSGGGEMLKWNGTNYQTYNGEDFIFGAKMDIEIFQNEFYLSGWIDTSLNTTSVHYIARKITNETGSVNSTCGINCNGSATAIPVGVAPQNYLWNNGATTQTIMGLCAGNYSVTVTDASGSPSIGSVTITAPPPINITESSSNSTCATCNDGSASVTVSGGSGMLHVLWNTGDTTVIITNQLQGLYTATVTDSNGCVITDTVIISYNIAAQATGQNSLCFETCTGSATAVSNGVIPFSYQWSNGETTQSIGGLCPNSYYVTITDSNGVTATDTIVITEPTQLLISDTSTNASCYTCNNGSATITANGGTPPFAYEWSNGATTSTIDSLLFGDYTVTVTDSNGCVVIDSVTVGFDVGTELLGADYKLQIYPNPANETVTITAENIKEVVVSNLLGEIVQSLRLKVQSNTATIDISKIPQGIYLLRVQTNDGWRVGKVVKGVNDN